MDVEKGLFGCKILSAMELENKNWRVRVKVGWMVEVVRWRVEGCRSHGSNFIRSWLAKSNPIT